jgi:hypothetical protein
LRDVSGRHVGGVAHCLAVLEVGSERHLPPVHPYKDVCVYLSIKINHMIVVPVTQLDFTLTIGDR